MERAFETFRDEITRIFGDGDFTIDLCYRMRLGVK